MSKFYNKGYLTLHVLSALGFSLICDVYSAYSLNQSMWLLEDKDLFIFLKCRGLKTQNMCYSSAVVEKNIWNSPFLFVCKTTHVNFSSFALQH